MKNLNRALITLSISAFCCLSVFSQNAYYDALKLAGYTNKETGKFELRYKNEVNAILATYVDTLVSDLLLPMDQIYSANQFITRNFPTTWQSGGFDVAGAGGAAGALSNLSGVNVTTVADGLAKFLVNRVKQELSTQFFVKFKKKLDEVPELSTLFPQTTGVLRVIDSEIYNYSAYLQFLKEAFEKDLSNLLQNIQQLIQKHPPAVLAKEPDLAWTFTTGLSVIEQLFNDEHPATIINTLISDQADTIMSKNLAGALQFFQLVSSSLESKSAEGFWVSVDSIKLLTHDPMALRYYFGLLFQQAAHKIVFEQGKLESVFKQLASAFTTNYDSVTAYINYLEGFVQKANMLQRELKSMQDVNGTWELTYREYYAFFTTTMDLFESIQKIRELPYVKIPAAKGIDRFLFTLNSVGEIYLDINQKNYSSALFNAIVVMDTILKGEFAYRSEVMKYGAFMVAVVNAENSTEVASAIEAIALPAGSATIKKYSSFNVALNAYLGGFAGHEYLKGVESKVIVNTMGMAAPVGVAFSKGFGKNNRGSISLFGSLVDIGAVTAFRFTNDSIGTLPELTLQNIIAPGAYLVIGIPGVPISLGGGWQHGPLLRKVMATSIETSTVFNNRLSVFLAVDIPILNFFTKPR